MSFAWSPLSDTQELAIARSTARINILEGAVRAGKTIASIIRWLEYLKTGPSGKKAVIGKTHRTLKRNVLDVIQQIVGTKHYYHNRGEGEVTIFGHTVDIYGANDERAMEKISGATLAGAYCDELSLWPESMFKMLLSRNSVEDAKIFGTTNPDSPHHWLKKEYLDREDELNLRSFHFHLEDNLSLSEQYKSDLKQEYVGLWYKRYILGEWCVAEGLVYDMFDEGEHIVRDLPKMRRTWVGIDYGTSNPTAFLLLGQGEDGNLYACREYTHAGGDEMRRSKTDLQYAEAFVAWLGGAEPQWVWIDPSAKSFRLQLWQMRSKHRVLKKVAPASNDLVDGIRKVGALLGAGRLKVHESCTDLMREMQLYRWDPKAQERGEDRPVDADDHTLDALRYIINGLGTVYQGLMREVAA